MPRSSSVRQRVDVPSFPELDRIVDLNVDLVKRAVASITVPSPAYALGLWPEDPELLAPTVICIGLDARREAMLSELDRWDVCAQVWNVSDYDLDAVPERDARTIPEFASLEPLVRMRLRAAEVVDPAEYVLNRIASALSKAPIVEPRTSDFVVFAFNEDFGDCLRRNIEFAASEEALSQLEAKGLLPEVFELPEEDDWPSDNVADESLREGSKVRRERLADGRILRVTLDGQYWVCELEGAGDAVVSSGESGRLSGAMLADLLGYDVADEEWPGWIDDLASKLERDMR